MSGFASMENPDIGNSGLVRGFGIWGEGGDKKETPAHPWLEFLASLTGGFVSLFEELGYLRRILAIRQ